METLVQREKNPREVISHHDLIKILVEHALHKEGHTWNNIIHHMFCSPKVKWLHFRHPNRKHLHFWH
jgi:hypothetical protein